MASILSSLFGVGTQQQQQPQAAAVTTQELPKQVAPYYEKLLKEAEALYKQKMEAGAPTYEGKTIAGFTPEQEQLFIDIFGTVKDLDKTFEKFGFRASTMSQLKDFAKTFDLKHSLVFPL